MYTITIDKTGRKLAAGHGERLSDVLRRGGIMLSMPCGGRGRCGKCRVNVNGKAALACQVYVTEDMEVSLPDEDGGAWIETDAPCIGLQLASRRESGIGVAIDLGTTTIAVYAVDLSSGKITGTAAELNNQRAYGADVISRITYCMEHEGGLAELSRMVRKQLARMAREAAGGGEIKKIVVAGNTVMEHILLGCDPSGLAAAPFKPVFLSGRQTELDGIRTYIMSCVSAYIGGDITAAIIGCGMYAEKDTCLLLDLGTNGEMVLKNGDTYYCCSVAAGPAFEGGHISCGTGSVAGAVYDVRLDGGMVFAGTIGEKPSVGICGSGLISAAAEMLDEGIIDLAGRILTREEQKPEWRRYVARDASAVTLTSAVRLTQKDIRELQTAKAAVRAGIDVLLQKAGVSYGDVKRVFLAGGMGANLPSEAAERIGMLPHEWRGRVQAAGNAAGGGTIAALADGSLMEAERIQGRACVIELADEAEFARLYIERMGF